MKSLKVKNTRNTVYFFGLILLLLTSCNKKFYNISESMNLTDNALSNFYWVRVDSNNERIYNINYHSDLNYCVKKLKSTQNHYELTGKDIKNNYIFCMNNLGWIRELRVTIH